MRRSLGVLIALAFLAPEGVCVLTVSDTASREIALSGDMEVMLDVPVAE